MEKIQEWKRILKEFGIAFEKDPHWSLMSVTSDWTRFNLEYEEAALIIKEKTPTDWERGCYKALAKITGNEVYVFFGTEPLNGNSKGEFYQNDSQEGKIDYREYSFKEFLFTHLWSQFRFHM